MNNEMPDEIYIQLGENRIGTEICLRKWSKEPFEDGTKYARADKAAPAWQPIETAPKDGTDIYATRIDGIVFRPSIIYWEKFEGRGWLCSQTHRPVSSQPTHWMPLPQPPTTEETK